MTETAGRNEGGTIPPDFISGRSCRIDLSRPRIMGVLNVTPDSFFDGGRYSTRDALFRRVGEMVDEGADLIDVGGESTRPGSRPVSAQEELDRIMPAIETIRSTSEVPISVDTTKAAVAMDAVAAGADFVNDISGLQFDDKMAAAVAGSGAGLFLMHTRGRPEVMQRDTAYRDVMAEVIGYLDAAIEKALGAGVAFDRIAVDPGIGFGKSVEGNLQLLRRLGELKVLGCPILLGTSRKSFIGKILQQEDPENRLAGSLATVALGVAAGARLFRVHDVRLSREAADVAWAVTGAGRFDIDGT